MAGDRENPPKSPQPAGQPEAPTCGFEAPWRYRMRVLQKAFPSPWREAKADQVFEAALFQAVSLVDQMKHFRAFHGQSAWQGYLGEPDLPDYSRCHEARLDADMGKPEAIVRDLVSHFNGMPNWNHPQIMANVVPPANTPAIIGAALCQIFNPNILEGEYSWNVAKAEIESAAMVADLIGWDPRRAGGFYTFGGTGCYLYGMKMALTSVLGKETRHSGIREDGLVLVSREAHYAKRNCADWTGLGTDNIREIDVDGGNRMDLAHLDEVLAECRRKNRPVVMVVCTMGTTDAFAVDPIEGVRERIDRYENAKGMGRPLVYADAVIGWSWLAFRSYDFRANPLRFSDQALAILERNYRLVEPLHHADAVGIDMHKTGWAPYTSSLFMVRDLGRFTDLLARPLPAYLQDRTPYNPFKYTLETSRSGAGAMAGWATLKLFGREGYQVMLGRIIEVGLFLRQLLERDKNLVCVNPDNHGFVTLFRVYPKHVDAAAQYEKELADPLHQPELRAYNILQQRVANKLFAMLRDPARKKPGWENPPYTSFTAGYRPPAYAPEEKDSRNLVYALKAFPMSPNSNELSMLMVRNYVLRARDLVIEEILAEGCPAESPVPAGSGAEPPGADVRCWFGGNESIDPRYLVSADSAPSAKPAPPEEGGTACRTVRDCLSRVPICSHLSESRLGRLVEAGREEPAAAGTVLFLEGDKADKVYLLLRGSVQAFRREKDGREAEIAKLGPGAFFGEMALFETGLRSAAVKALEDSALFVIDGETFLDLVLG